MDLLSNLPAHFQDFEQLWEITYTEESELERIYRYLKRAVNESIISKATSRRLREWEEALEIKSLGTFEQRRQLIKAVLAGTGKLDEEGVKKIVKVFTGNNSLVSLENSVLIVKVISPNFGEIFLYEDVINALRPRVPAHISLKVIKYYATWKDVKETYNSWGDVKSKSWGEISVGSPANI